MPWSKNFIRICVVFSLLGTSMTAGSVLRADTKTTTPTPAQVKKASQEFQAGVKAAETDQDEEAALHFENADGTVPSREALLLAIKHRGAANQFDRAAGLAELGVQRYPNDKEFQEILGKIVTQNSKKLHKIKVHCEPACELIVGVHLVHGGAHADRTLYVKLGTQKVVAGWGEDSSVSKEVDASTPEGESQLDFTKPPPKPGAEPDTKLPPGGNTGDTKPQQPPPPPPGSGLSPGIFIAGAVVTGVLGGVTVWSGLDTKNNPGADAVKTACVNKGTNCSEYQDGLSRQKRTNILLGTTVGVGVISIVIGAFFTNWGSDHQEKAPTATGFNSLQPFLGVTPGGATFSASGRF
jgi:hypothetical protein